MADQEQDLLARLQKIGPDGTTKAPPTTPSDPTEVVETGDEDVETGSSTPVQAVSSVTAGNVFRHPDSHPIVLDLLLLQHFGVEWMGWEPEVVEFRIQEDFKTSLSAVNAAKIHAANSMHLVDSFWEQWEVFLWCTMSLNGVPPDFEVLQVPTVAQVLVSVDIANRIRTDIEWSNEVKEFISVVYDHDGIYFALPPADFVTPHSNGLSIDTVNIAKSWPDVRAGKIHPTSDDITGEQLRRLATAHQYLEESRARLRQQLPLVSHALLK